MNGATCWVIPITLAFACIMYHVAEDDRNFETISGCTRERGESYFFSTDTLSSLFVSADSLGCTGARRANIASISVVRGTVTSPRGIHYICNTTVAGSWPR